MRTPIMAPRVDICRFPGHVLRLSSPIAIERHGRPIHIVALERPSRLASLPRRPHFVTGDTADLVHMDWSAEWRPPEL